MGSVLSTTLLAVDGEGLYSICKVLPRVPKTWQYPIFPNIEVARNSEELHAIVKSWPFRGWAFDLIGQTNPSLSKGHKFILVGVNYFTKWVEAMPLKDVTPNEIINFIEQNIIHYFGIPQTLTIDQGTMFTSRKVMEYAS